MGDFGSRLLGLRKAKKLSQDELAVLLGKSKKQVISSWENNKAKPSADDLAILASVLETTADYLLSGRDENAAFRELQMKYYSVLEEKNALLEEKATYYQQRSESLKNPVATY